MNKSLFQMYAMALAMGGMSMDSYPENKHHYIDNTPPLTDEQKERLRIERLKAKGLKEFEINGVTIVALNYKSAQKKYLKLKNK